MKRPRVALALVASAALALPAFALERSDVVRRELSIGPGANRWVEIDNVFGGVEVRAGAGDRVVVEIRRLASARRESDLELAFTEVQLEVEPSPDGVALVQGGPFRCGERRGDSRRHGRPGWGGGCDWDPDYEVEWRWTVTVPSDVDLDVRTVNEGRVVVDGVRGELRVGNVNGPIRLSGVAGSVHASTVNGGIRASYAVAPSAEGRFQTVNGEIELEMPEGSAADVELETMNGELWSDFDVRAVTAESRRGRDGRTFRLERDTVVRIGGGGPRFECKTLNGDIVLRAR